MRRTKSCLPNLSAFHDEMTTSFVWCRNFDDEKAVDTLFHNILIHKLDHRPVDAKSFLERNNPMPKYRLWTAWLENTSTEKDLVYTRLTWVSNAPLQQKKVSSTWGCIRGIRLHWQHSSGVLVLFWTPQYKTDMNILKRAQKKGYRDD